MIVDFGQAEPLQVLTSSGQSGNPASAITATGWMPGSRALHEPAAAAAELRRAYGNQRLTLVPGR
jgi:acyl-homoserine-lactone acylase